MDKKQIEFLRNGVKGNPEEFVNDWRWCNKDALDVLQALEIALDALESIVQAEDPEDMYGTARKVLEKIKEIGN